MDDVVDFSKSTMAFGNLGSAKLVVNAANHYTFQLIPHLVTAEHERIIWIAREESEMGIPAEGVGEIIHPSNDVEVRTYLIPPVEFSRSDHYISVEGLGR